MVESILSIHEPLGSVSRIPKTAREKEREKRFTVCFPLDVANSPMRFIKQHRARRVCPRAEDVKTWQGSSWFLQRGLSRTKSWHGGLRGYGAFLHGQQPFSRLLGEAILGIGENGHRHRTSSLQKPAVLAITPSFSWERGALLQDKGDTPSSLSRGGPSAPLQSQLWSRRNPRPSFSLGYKELVATLPGRFVKRSDRELSLRKPLLSNDLPKYESSLDRALGNQMQGWEEPSKERTQGDPVGRGHESYTETLKQRGQKDNGDSAVRKVRVLIPGTMVK